MTIVYFILGWTILSFGLGVLLGKFVKVGGSTE